MKPRDHAFEILKLDNREERNLYLKTRVEDRFQALVMEHVKIWWPKRQRILHPDQYPKITSKKEYTPRKLKREYTAKR